MFFGTRSARPQMFTRCRMRCFMIQLEIYDLHMKTDIREPGAVEILMSHRHHYRMKQQLNF
jgi:hypothetical protein